MIVHKHISQKFTIFSCAGCLAWQFQCKNGECIATHAMCDGHYDCADRSDETDWAGCEIGKLKIDEGFPDGR